jgi:site-specific DNA recombinase
MEKILSLNKFAKGAEIATAKKSNNCVIYTRVSTKEQADNNLSLETQKKGCEAYVLKLKYDVLSYFGGTYESAASDERKEFKRMIDFAKKQKTKISYIIVYSLERFSRTGDNAIWLSRQLRDLGISIISVTQPIDTSNPSGILQQNILFLFGQYDNDLRKQKSMAGTREKLLTGLWCTKAPMGYDNVRRNGERFIEINNTGKLIRKAFLWKANENNSNTEIIQKLAQLGLKTTLKFLAQIFRNPFYCGLLSHKALGGEMVEGKHTALVSKEIFLKVNDIKYCSVGSKYNSEFESTPLKLFFKCDTCGEHLRGYLVKAKRLHYYKCDNKKKCSCNKSAKDLHKIFKVILSELTLDKKYISLLKLQLEKIYNELNEGKDRLNEQFQKQLMEVKKKVERLEERFVNEEIKVDLYEKFITKFKQEEVEIKAQMQGSPISTSNLEKYINRTIELSTELPSLWTSGNYAEKQRLQKLLFKDGIYYNKQKNQTRTTNVNSVFSLIASLQDDTGQKNNRPQSENHLRSVSVSGSRLELPTFGL